jgi:phytoene synthase
MNELHSSFQFCREITKKASSTFYLGSKFFPSELQSPVWAIYAFCRITDDLIDSVVLPESYCERQDTIELMRKYLDSVRKYISFLFVHRAEKVTWDSFVSVYADLSLPQSYRGIFDALYFTISNFPALGEAPFLALIDGMEMDLTVSRYATYESLAEYSYKVAGGVGEMICNLCGSTNSETICYAYMLGEAMQLTNILRDVGEDYARDRVYLAENDITAYGVDLASLVEIARSGHWSTERTEVKNFILLMNYYIDANRSLYKKSLTHLSDLPYRVHKPIHLAAFLYSEILSEIEKREYNVFSKRVHVSFSKKMQLMLLSKWS